MRGAGAYDRRIVIERRQTGRDAMNDPVTTWTEIATVSAEWKRGSRSERQQIAEQRVQVPDTFVTRWTPVLATVAEPDRIRFDGRTYDITGVVELGRRERLEISAMAAGRLVAGGGG
ncbi:MAG: phage head closure protein [Pseudomonadota bacterium]